MIQELNEKHQNHEKIIIGTISALAGGILGWSSYVVACNHKTYDKSFIVGNVISAVVGLGFGLSSYYMGFQYENENNYLPNHMLCFRLPWCQRNITKLEREAEEYRNNDQDYLELECYLKILKIEPKNKHYRNKVATLRA